MSASTDTKGSSERLVRDFLGAWNGRDIETICGVFAADAMYHNVPVKPIHGLKAIRPFFEAFLEAFEYASLDIITLAAEPGLVIAERIDRFVMRNGTRIDCR